MYSKSFCVKLIVWWFYMEDKIVHKFIAKVKDKLSRNKTTYPSVSEYAFSSEEIEDMTKQNKQKIQELKQDLSFSAKKKEKETSKLQIDNEVLSPVETQTVIDVGLDQKMIQEYQDQNEKKQEVTETIEKNKPKEVKEQEAKKSKGQKNSKNSFINLKQDHQQFIMEKWNEIDSNQIEKDIIEGKNLLNHNYTSTYADDASRYIHHIRKNYDVVICYLIGFNNEKKGIYDKTTFSSKMDEEWKYLNSYIKVLEKIKSFKK